MTLRNSLAALLLTAGLVGVSSKASAQVSVSPGITGVTIGGSNGAGLYIPYGGGGVTFGSPGLGAWNYSNGTISPSYNSYYTPFGSNYGYNNYGYNNLGYNTFGYGNSYYNPYSYSYTPYSNWGGNYWGGNYNSYYTPSTNWGSYYPSYGNFRMNNGRHRGWR